MAKYVSKDYAQAFTDRVIEILESGKKLPWSKPWASQGGYRNAITQRPYSGVNVFILMLSAELQGFKSEQWATFKQISEAGGKVKKGSVGTQIAYFNAVEVEDRDTKERKNIFVRKFFTVFNAEQVEGIEFTDETPVYAEHSDDERKLALENHLFAYAKNEGIAFNTGGDRAYYYPAGDAVQMPNYFKDVAGYCGVLAHEFIHSTGNQKRLDRFGEGALKTLEHREEYAQEELVAEMGAGLLCGMFGIESRIDNHVSYLASWLRALKNDKEFIFKAASQAQKAIDFIANAVAQEEVKTA